MDAKKVERKQAPMMICRLLVIIIEYCALYEVKTNTYSAHSRSFCAV